MMDLTVVMMIISTTATIIIIAQHIPLMVMSKLLGRIYRRHRP
jgi:hypothetical protein